MDEPIVQARHIVICLVCSIREIRIISVKIYHFSHPHERDLLANNLLWMVVWVCVQRCGGKASRKSDGNRRLAEDELSVEMIHHLPRHVDGLSVLEGVTHKDDIARDKLRMRETKPGDNLSLLWNLKKNVLIRTRFRKRS